MCCPGGRPINQATATTTTMAKRIRIFHYGQARTYAEYFMCPLFVRTLHESLVCGWLLIDKKRRRGGSVALVCPARLSIIIVLLCVCQIENSIHFPYPPPPPSHPLKQQQQWPGTTTAAALSIRHEKDSKSIYPRDFTRSLLHTLVCRSDQLNSALPSRLVADENSAEQASGYCDAMIIIKKVWGRMVIWRL